MVILYYLIYLNGSQESFSDYVIDFLSSVVAILFYWALIFWTSKLFKKVFKKG